MSFNSDFLTVHCMTPNGLGRWKRILSPSSVAVTSGEGSAGLAGSAAAGGSSTRDTPKGVWRTIHFLPWASVTVWLSAAPSKKADNPRTVSNNFIFLLYHRHSCLCSCCTENTATRSEEHTSE